MTIDEMNESAFDKIAYETMGFNEIEHFVFQLLTIVITLYNKTQKLVNLANEVVWVSFEAMPNVELDKWRTEGQIAKLFSDSYSVMPN